MIVRTVRLPEAVTSYAAAHQKGPHSRPTQAPSLTACPVSQPFRNQNGCLETAPVWLLAHFLSLLPLSFHLTIELV